MARRFFKYLVAQGVMARNPLDEGPLGGERRPRNTPFRPFIFTQAQIAAILAAAKRLPPNHLFPLRPQVCYTMIRLLYALGLRLGEALRLCLQDVDLDRGTLLIRQTKFHKSRLLPFGPRIRDCLRQYLVARRNVLRPPRGEDPLFVALWRRPMGAATIGAAFHNLLAEVGLRKRKGVRGPRVHDLRHAFAVHRLLRWYREDVDVQSRLMLLATFMGHVEIRSTEVYLTITAELLQEASNRFHRGFGSVIRKEV